ncbi:filament-like plant protein isoform X1 [Quercus robur]|uniref:filament-like plant protein isoform X1 n=1 Tax=Quercus robur TaxID=38942 RepID=UPI0021623A26|nr:filament-like plant protein isoform X1 [Quercus robur]XP_050251208.1 filament-like plant protein isoform X1 [Quercus robur]XP_050251209.1 filament-like plant protein isoform X1 [Quercus robur]XP_050251210.1 filament-like plant protein isoform X1 [Quercus robur]XP_050251211.1 filament-like plant protein isoform X1 [Quercus robur]XP_050251212.1 filament-like plant protein isoform X1 [Quercus robur]XP_050251213.1 filament-like plant protein isoform X1 [Quercus robur]
MEKRKWLWKRKSSDKSPGETESSGSISSHSERYSDDQEAFKSSPNHNTQSPEVTSKAVASAEDVNDSVKSLMDKLSAALVNISAKEDLVKQHAKVAEEAVAGWEKAENEVIALKQQLDSAVQENSVLEDRVSHLDGALKELVRQLRQAREEQEQKIQEAVVKKTREWETTKLKLENQLLVFQSEAEAPQPESPTHVDPDICCKLESLEKENSVLKIELQSQSEELEIRTIERDLSTQAAETASKQHLESIKKVAKLEAECRRLKSVVCKSSSVNDHKSTTASSIYVESLTDSQSDSGERLSLGEIDTRKMGGSSEPKKCEPSCSDSWASALIAELDQFKNEKAFKRNLPSSSAPNDLMDDFLEMERLAALPETKNGSHYLLSKVSGASINGESSMRIELEAMTHRNAELEEKLEKMEAKKIELETALITTRDYIEASQVQLMEAEVKLEELQRELYNAKESKQVLESRLISMEAEARTMSVKVESLEIKVQRERALSAEIAAQCQELEEELSRKMQEIELQKTASLNGELKIKHEAEVKLEELQMELNTAKELKQVLESRLICMEAEARTMSVKVDSLEVKFQNERALSAEIAAKCQELEEELSRKKQEVEQKTASSNGELKIKQEAEVKLEELQRELNTAKESKQVLESRLVSMEAEARAMSVKVGSLEVEVQKERALSEEIVAKCRELEEELSRKEQEVELQKTASSNGELKIKQEAEVKLEELQRELNTAKELKQVLESRLISMEAEARTMSVKVDSLEVEVQKERALSAEIVAKCRELEEELSRKNQEFELQKTASSNGESKIKQEDLAVAAGKLAECQKTIASLGNQLKSLATLEDFLIDPANLPEFSAGASLIPKPEGDLWKLHCNQTFSPKRNSDSLRIASESSGPLINKNEENSLPFPSSSTSSAILSNHVSSEKNRNGFAKFFSRTKSGIRLEI